MSRHHHLSKATSSSNTSEQSVSGWVAKPPRMRSACTQCHSAKIRCSGDKDGCQRCNTLGLHCEYVVSMVGRAPKRQHKGSDPWPRKTNSLPAASQPPDHPPPPMRTSCPSARDSAAQGSDSATIGGSDIFDISCLVFPSSPPPSHINLADDQIFDCSASESWASGASARPAENAEGQSFPDMMSYETDSFPMSSDAACPRTTGPPSSLPMSLQPKPLMPSTAPGLFPISPREPPSLPAAAALHSGQDLTQFAHIAALSKMVQLLESHVQSQETAVDEIMRLNQSCIRDISKISANKEYMQCRSCPALISTIMELIVTLYEGISTAQSHEEIPSSALTKATAPSLQFGVFELDAKEQVLIRSNIIRNEARKCLVIIKALKKLLESELDCSDQPSSRNLALGNWYDGMEKRMEDLISNS